MALILGYCTTGPDGGIIGCVANIVNIGTQVMELQVSQSLQAAEASLEMASVSPDKLGHMEDYVVQLETDNGNPMLAQL